MLLLLFHNRIMFSFVSVLTSRIYYKWEIPHHAKTVAANKTSRDELTDLPMDKIDAISQTIFSVFLVNENLYQNVTEMSF